MGLYNVYFTKCNVMGTDVSQLDWYWGIPDCILQKYSREWFQSIENHYGIALPYGM